MVRRAEPHEIDLNAILQTLRMARTKRNVRLTFKDGRQIAGAVTFVERLGKGRVIDIDREFAASFSIYDLSRVETDLDEPVE